jgi:CheY-like chemotaxis protein
VKVVIASGYMDAKDMERAKACGVHECIRKPNTLDEMRDMVTALLPNV